MKKVFLKKLLFVFLISTVFQSCTNESSDFINEESINAFENPSVFQRSTGEVYEEYITLFDDLYGKNFLVENTILYKQSEGDYYVTKVVLLENSEGYFVELPDRNVVYLDHNMSTGILKFYDYDNVSKEMVLTNHDLTLDSEYDYSPLAPNSNHVEGRRRFWGWTKPNDINWSDCAPDGLQYATITHYVFWQENGTQQITRPCR